MRSNHITLTLFWLLANATHAQDHDLASTLRAFQDEQVNAALSDPSAANEPINIRFLYHKALQSLEADQPEAALEDLDRLIHLDPGHVNGLLRRSEAFARIGDFAAAQSDLLTVLVVNSEGPVFEGALLQLGIYALHQGEHTIAHDYFDLLVTSSSLNSAAQFYRGITRASLGRDSEALADIQEALLAKPELVQGYTQIGILLLRMGRRSEACAALRQAHFLGDRSVEEMLLVHCDE